MSKEKWYEYIKMQWDFIKRNLDGDQNTDEFWPRVVNDANKTINDASDQDREYVKTCIMAVLNKMQSDYVDMKRGKNNG